MPDGSRPAGSARVPAWLRTSTAWTWRLLVLGAGATALVLVATHLAIVTVPVLLALVLATLAGPPTRWLCRRGAAPAVAATVVLGGSLALLGVGAAALAPEFVAQTRDLGPTLAAAGDDVLTWVEEGPIGLDRDDLAAVALQLAESAQEEGGQVAAAVGAVLTATLEAVVGLVLAVVLLFFLIKDGEAIAAWVVARSPERHRATVFATGRRGWEALAGFVRNTVLVATVDAVGVGIGLLLLGVPLVLPLTLLVFLGAFVPVVGAFVAGLVAVLVALADGGLSQAGLVLGVVVLVQQLESDVLQPRLVRRAVPLHPVVVLLVLTAGVALVGVVGAFLAVPVTAVVVAVANELRLRHETPGEHGPEPLGGNHEQAPVAAGDQSSDTSRR